MSRKTVLVFLMVAFVGAGVRSQDGEYLSEPQLEQLTAPVALYPDPLLAQILAAATQPSQVALAYNYVTSGGDPNAIDSQPWDDSVKAIAHYSQVLQLMDGDLAWTTQLGQAFLNDPSDVMSSVQQLRAQAQNLGNLQSSAYQDVESDDGNIEIMPANPDTLYVPTYDPGVIFYQPCYGQNFITWGAGYGIGIWLNHDFDWHGRHLVTWDRDHPRPANWWHAAPAERRGFIGHAVAWHAPAGAVRRPVVVNHFDRGYVSRPVLAPREPTPSSVQVHTIPARPTVSANISAHVAAPEVRVFGDTHSAAESRAASSRGSESRGVSRPAPAPAIHSGGGGGGGHGGGGRR